MDMVRELNNTEPFTDLIATPLKGTTQGPEIVPHQENIITVALYRVITKGKSKETRANTGINELHSFSIYLFPVSGRTRRAITIKPLITRNQQIKRGIMHRIQKGNSTRITTIRGQVNNRNLQ